MSSSGEFMQEMERAGELLTRVELDLARASEKLLNLDVLVMHVATRESDFENFVSEKEQTLGDSARKALEFDLLSGILESELKELELYLLNLQPKIGHAYEIASSSEHFGEVFKEIQEKLSDSDKSLKQTLEQVSELRVQSNNFNRMISNSAGGKDGRVTKDAENGPFPDMSSKIKMQTAEQQRHVLGMLEKSLAREIDLEKKLTEARESEKLLRLRMQQEVLCMEEEVEDTWEKLFESQNAYEILLGMSKELVSKQQILQFNYNGFIKREGELKSRCEDLNEQLKVSNSSAAERESLINELRGEVAKAEDRAESAEAECKYRGETNMELSKDLDLAKSIERNASEKASFLEKRLRDCDIQLQHAVASVEASQEKQTMMYSMIKDMETLINDLKAKCMRADRQAENAEEKCIILSEANSSLNEELSFLRSRVESLETSLHQNEETKKATVVDISVRTKLITDLVMQLTNERERLHKQISSLTREKRILSKRLLQHTTKDHLVSMKKTGEGTKPVHEYSSAESAEGNVGEATDLTGTGTKGDRKETVTLGNVGTGSSDSTVSAGTLRNIDARQLNLRYILVAGGVLLVSLFVASLLTASE